MCKILSLVIVLMIACAVMFATTTVIDVQFGTPKIVTDKGNTALILEDAQIYGNPGAPGLPYRGIKLLIPEGEEAIAISVEKLNSLTLPGKFNILPIGRPMPFEKMNSNDDKLIPDSKIYSLDAFYPGKPDNGVVTHFLSGYAIAFSAVTPIEYNPVTKEIRYATQLRITVESTPTSSAMNASGFIKRDAFTVNRISQAIDNMERIPRALDRPGMGYDYIMIIDDAKVAQWQPLKDYYESKGMNVLLQSIQDIQLNETGSDLQMKLRNYLIQSYTDNPLKYVLLCGDTDVIPHRGFYVNNGQAYIDNDIPADMYYSCLDGNWNNDNDANWGEVYETDLAPEFAIGRMCYNSDTEISNQINKIIMYQTAPVENETKTALFAGEWLWDGPTWAGDYMDEMIDGSSTHGYTTVGIPATWDIETLYDRTYGYADAWGSSEILPLLSHGNNFVNHLGHSATTYNMRLSANQVTASNITNNGINHNFSIIFTQGCYAGAFDNRDTEPGQYVGDCITEKFTGISTAAVGMIAHSRYGWGQQGGTDGASQYIHRQYIDAIFGENIHELGFALVDSKIDNIPFITNQDVMYWVDYETNLIGDPAMMVWTDTPQNVTVSTQSPWLVGQSQYQINTNAPNAVVRLSQNGNMRYQGTTDASGLGIVTIFGSLDPGQYDLHINAANFYPSHTLVQVQASTSPYIVCTAVVINNPDNLLQAGESVSLNVTLKNIGMVSQSQNGTLSLSTTSPLLTIQNSTGSFNALAVGDSVTLNGIFNVVIGNSFADLTAAALTLTVNFDGNSSTHIKNLILNAPVLQIARYQFDNNGGPIMPGDSPELYVTVENTGSGSATGILITWMNENPYVTLSSQETVINLLPPGAELFVTQPIIVSVSDSAPIGDTPEIGYYIGAESGEGDDGIVSFYIGLINYSFENDWENWTHQTMNASYTDQWNRNSAQHYSGNWSIKFGGEGSSNYADEAYGAFISPEIALGTNACLKFYHCMDAEDNAGEPGMAWDGGLVEMSLNGAEWIQIAPDGGYPYLNMDNQVSPFAADTPVFSGEFDWQEETFDLSAFSGNARFRFVFGSDGAVTGEGWYIDNIRVDMEYLENSDNVLPNSVILYGNYPNPFNPQTYIRFALPAKQNVTIEIYNIKGQLVKTLFNNASKPAGTHNVVWNGMDNHSLPVGSGMYLYKIKSGTFTTSRKMLLLK